MKQITLPEAVHSPCKECPWRKNATTGHLGPYSAEEWIDIVKSEEAIACHMTFSGNATWSTPGIRQCKGAATFRDNICKLPKNRTDAAYREVSQDEKSKVFRQPGEFIEYHTSK